MREFFRNAWHEIEPLLLHLIATFVLLFLLAVLDPVVGYMAASNEEWHSLLDHARRVEKLFLRVLIMVFPAHATIFLLVRMSSRTAREWKGGQESAVSGRARSLALVLLLVSVTVVALFVSGMLSGPRSESSSVDSRERLPSVGSGGDARGNISDSLSSKSREGAYE